jgi:hypothetical protein
VDLEEFGLYATGSGQGPVAAHCEDDNDSRGISYQLSDYQFLKKDSV